MVLLTLLGLTALLLSEKREDEPVDQSDELPLSSTHGQASQQTTSDPEVLATEEEPTGHPEIDGDGIYQDFVCDSTEQSTKALHALNSVACDFNFNTLDIPHVPGSVVSDCGVDVPKTSDNPTEDTVAPQSSQLKGNEATRMDINACWNKTGVQLSDYALEEDYSEPLPLTLQNQLSEDQERDGALDNKTESDSKVPVPDNDTPGVIKVLSGLSSQWKNWWERYSGENLTLTVISFFFIAIYLKMLSAAVLHVQMDSSCVPADCGPTVQQFSNHSSNFTYCSQTIIGWITVRLYPF